MLVSEHDSKGAFAAARVRNLGRQRVFDAIKEMREKGEAWVTMRESSVHFGNAHSLEKLYRCRIVDGEIPYSDVLVASNGQVTMSDVIDKDGLWVNDSRGNRRCIGGSTRIVAYVAEKHLVAE